MTLTMHQATVSTCSRALNNLAAILEKAAAYAEARKIDPAVLLNTGSFPTCCVERADLYCQRYRGGGAARLAASKCRRSMGRIRPCRN